ELLYAPADRRRGATWCPGGREQTAAVPFDLAHRAAQDLRRPGHGRHKKRAALPTGTVDRGSRAACGEEARLTLYAEGEASNGTGCRCGGGARAELLPLESEGRRQHLCAAGAHCAG